MPLVLAATPIGNPDDASPRLRRLLETADVVAAEDTRRLRRLASALDVVVSGRIVAVYDAVERGRSTALLDDLREGRTVLLVSDAGMPLVSDPGHVLVSEAIAQGLSVTVLPGPSAVTTAIALSGLAVERFCFEGFLPRRAGERRTRLSALAGDSRALVAFESPRRLARTLADLTDVFGRDRAAAVCRELTKTYEEVRRGTLAELAEWAATHEVLGEITLVIAGAPEKPRPASVGDLGEGVVEELRNAVALAVTSGSSRRDAIGEVAAARGLPRRVVYAAAVTKR